MMLAAAVTSGIAAASENMDGRVAAAKKIVVRDDDSINPSALTMSHDDVLEFENDSGQFMRLVFVEPQDQTDKIRCYPIGHTVGRPDQAPWLLFDLVAQNNVPVYFDELARVVAPGGRVLITSTFGPATPYYTPHKLLERRFRKLGFGDAQSEQDTRKALLETERVVEHLRHRRQAVRGA